VNLVLWRREFLELRELSGWLLVFGRRKTGKSFLARLMIPWNLYVTVTRDLAAIVEEREGVQRIVNLEEAMKLVSKSLVEERCIVIDEFQRLPPRYWDLLATRHPSGCIVLVASSLGIMNKVFDSRSPLLGLVQPLRIDPLHLSDVITSLMPRARSLYQAILWAPLLREPWLVPLIGNEWINITPWSYIASKAYELAQVTRGLVGEVFEEEERRLTRLYEAVLRLLGAGVWSSNRMASMLYQRGLLPRASPSLVTGILDKLVRIGLVTKTRLWKTRGAKMYYRHSSPLLAIVYGIMEKHGVDETPYYSRRVVENTALQLYSRELQFSLGELMAEYHEGIYAYTVLPQGEGDIDIIILSEDAKKPIAAYEVKLGTCNRHDAVRAIRRARLVNAPLTGMVCLRGVEEELEIPVLGPEDIAERARIVVKRLSAPTNSSSRIAALY